jgi:hypothetical protein
VRSLVEEAYFQAWGKAGGIGRLRRTFSLFVSIRRMLELQIKRAEPGLSARELNWRTAKRMYCASEEAQRLLDRAKGPDMLADDFPETAARLLAILNELGLKFHFTGGIAASYYGDPRLTQDLDLVIQLGVGRPETRILLDRLRSGYLIDEQIAREAIRGNRLFQAIDEKSMIKIDFHVGEKIPGELARSMRCEISPGLVAPLVSKEDAILSKLIWIKKGSGKSVHDVKEMLRRDEDLDRAVLAHRAATLGLHDLLAEISKEMQSGPLE